MYFGLYSCLSVCGCECTNLAIDVTDAEVKASFDNWQYTPKPVNKTEMALREIYGDQVNEVLNYIQAQKRVETKLSTPEYKQKFNAAIEKLIPVPGNE